MTILLGAIIGIICILALAAWLNPRGPKTTAETEAEKYFRLRREDDGPETDE